MKQNLRHVEVYNGNTDKPTRFDTSLWDSVLTTAECCLELRPTTRIKKPLRQGLDLCLCLLKGSGYLFNAIRNGEFYASNGIVIDTVGSEPEKFFVRSSNGTRITFIGSSGRVWKWSMRTKERTPFAETKDMSGRKVSK